MALIPFDDRDGSIWMDGEIVPWRDAKAHTLSHGLHYASLVFEGERVYAGKIFKEREHTVRLRQSSKLLDLKVTAEEMSNDLEINELLGYEQIEKNLAFKLEYQIN